MKRIGVFLDSRPGGGSFQYNLSILDALAALPRDEYGWSILYTQPEWEPYLREYQAPARHLSRGLISRAIGRAMRCHRQVARLWRHLSGFLHPLGRALRRARCDLWVFPTQDGMCYQYSVPSLEVVHDLMHRYESRFPEVSAGGEFERREKHYAGICRYANGILVDSEVGRKQLDQSYTVDVSRVHVLPYVPPHYIFAAPAQEDALPGFELPQKYLFYPAQFWEHKNHRALVQAVASLTDLTDIHLLLVGSKMNGFDALVETVRECGLEQRVHFPGYVEDQYMPLLYRRARALVMPTFFGPTNIPPLEAFVCGCPVAVSGIYGMPAQMGDAALLFDPLRVDSMADAVRRLWTDDALCAQLVEAGHRRIDQWNQQHFNQQFQAVIERVIEADS